MIQSMQNLVYLGFLGMFIQRALNCFKYNFHLFGFLLEKTSSKTLTVQ